MALPEFALETYFARWEFTVRYNLTVSDAQAVSLARLLELADPDDRAEWDSLTLGYTPTRGAPSLRDTRFSEVLARIAFKARQALLVGTREVIAANLPHFAAFFARHAGLFAWSPPDGGCVCYPRYLGPDGVEDFCRAAVQEGGVLLLPASVYASPLVRLPDDRFRVGIGRADAPEGLAALEEFLGRRA